LRKNTAFVETSLLIRADIRTVWERLVDFERYHEWNPFIVGVRRDWADPALMKFDLVWGTGGRGTSRERMVSLAAPENGRAALVYDYAAFLSACGLVKASRTQSLRAVGDHTEYHTREDFSGLLK
jgi:hypothetical protein